MTNELFTQRVESAKDQRRMKTMEIMGQNGSDMDVCDDELLDDQELDH